MISPAELVIFCILNLSAVQRHLSL